MNSHIYCCCKKCYRLVHCDTAAVLYTKDGLSANIGDVVDVAGECYTVEELGEDTCGDLVTVGDVHGDCAACEAAVEPPCPCNIPDGCLACGDCTPDTIRTAVSGIELCACVDGFQGGGSFKPTLSVAMNGAHTLIFTPHPSVCIWQVVYPNALTISNFLNNTCGGAPDSSSTVDFAVQLRLSLGVWSFAMGPIDNFDVGGYFGGTTPFVGGSCATVPNISSALTSCSNAEEAQGAHGGVATFAICP